MLKILTLMCDMHSPGPHVHNCLLYTHFTRVLTQSPTMPAAYYWYCETVIESDDAPNSTNKAGNDIKACCML